MKIPKNVQVELERQAAIYKAVGHPLRLAIMRNFNTCGCQKLTVKSIYEELNIEQPVASHHLGILKRSGILKREQASGNTYYRISEEDNCVRSILQQLKL